MELWELGSGALEGVGESGTKGIPPAKERRVYTARQG